jgi:hypothetical protein
MIELVRRLTRNRDLSRVSADDVELCTAREHLQNALHVLERTLQSMDGHATDGAARTACLNPAP